MFISFKVANYRSIGEAQTLNLQPLVKYKDYPENIFSAENHQSLNAVALYGANASGKSNLLKAIGLMDKLIFTSAKSNSTDKLPFDPFWLKKALREQPTSLEITFIAKKIRYRYGFRYDATQIVEEYLYRKSTGREIAVFLRQGDTIETSSGFKGNKKLIEAAIEATKENALFLSVCDMLNVEEAKLILRWFSQLHCLEGIQTEPHQLATMSLWEQESYQHNIKNYLSQLQLGFDDIQVAIKEFDMADLPADMSENDKVRLSAQLRGKKGFKTTTSHAIYDEQGKKTAEAAIFLMSEQESEGTKKAFHLSGHIIKVLTDGGVLVIDEIEAKMHPLLTLSIIQLFLNADSNPQKAQIIFATHDSNLLTYAQFRRDQIYFVEKNRWESTELYSLADFRYFEQAGNAAERIDSDKEKRYLEGRYGAVPLINAQLLISKYQQNGEKGQNN